MGKYREITGNNEEIIRDRGWVCQEMIKRWFE